MILKISALALLLVITLSSAQSPPPPPGQMIDVGGYRVHVHCTGTGSPTVMVVGGGYSFDWTLVQTEVAKSTRICTYDPSGTAWSDPGPPLSCRARVSEVRQLLGALKAEGPIVIVGLSVGAQVARLYASLYPKDVAGMVIVDHAFLDIGPPAAPATAADRGGVTAPVLIFQTPIVLTVEDTSDFGKLPASIQKLHRWADSLKPVLPTVEMAEDCRSQLKAAASLGDLPLSVVSTGNVHPNYGRLQRDLLGLSTRSMQFMAEKSFHSVEIDQPEVVVDAISRVVELIRERP